MLRRHAIFGLVNASFAGVYLLTHYIDAQTIDHAIAEIQSASGTQFDPSVVTAFLELDHIGLVHQAYA